MNILIKKEAKKTNKGAKYEDAAVKHTQARGLNTIAQNFNCHCGEIDIVSRKNNTLIFIEVKYRKNNAFGLAAEQVTKTKQRRILCAAKTFLVKNKKFQDFAVRFDVIAVTTIENTLQFDWIENAFY